MLTFVAMVILLGIGSIWLAWRTKLPSILVLLAAGLLAGPIARAVTPALFGQSISLDPTAFISQHVLMEFVALAVGLILFEGGLTLTWREIAEVRRVVMLLVTIGALVTFGLASVAAHVTLGLDWQLSFLLAAVLVVTGPTVIGPLLRFIRPTGKVGPVLRWEGITIDPIGALLAVLVYEVIASGISAPESFTASATALAMIQRAIVTLGVGIVVGYLAGQVLVAGIRLHLVPDNLHIPITLAVIVGAFIGSNAIAHDAGLFATTVLGIVMANQQRANVRHILEFKENITTMLIAVLFIALAARLELAELLDFNFGAIFFLLALILIVRPASVLLSTLGSSLKFNERLFICWMAPRGIVAASVASLFALRLDEIGVAGADRIVTDTFLVIVATVALYGLTAAPVARALGLAKAGQRGFLIVGADILGRAIAKFLVDEKRDVLLVDVNPEHIRQARLLGIPVALGNALSTDILERVELSPLGHLLALTPNDEVNAMAAVQFGRIFGRKNVYQLPEKQRPSLPSSRASADLALVGRKLFNPDADHPRLENWLEAGAKLTKTKLTQEFKFENYLARNIGRAIPLMIMNNDGVRMLTHEKQNPPKAGDQIISLMLPETVTSPEMANAT